MKTHCQNGHEFTSENTRRDKNGFRICRACVRRYASNRDPKYRRKLYQQTRTSLWRKYSQLKAKAKFHDQDFALSKIDYEILIRDGLCSYCNKSLPEVGYGIDRKDNRMGYVHGNCSPCCESCNLRKGHLEGAGFVYPRTVELLLEILNQ